MEKIDDSLLFSSLSIYQMLMGVQRAHPKSCLKVCSVILKCAALSVLSHLEETYDTSLLNTVCIFNF